MTLPLNPNDPVGESEFSHGAGLMPTLAQRTALQGAVAAKAPNLPVPPDLYNPTENLQLLHQASPAFDVDGIGRDV